MAETRADTSPEGKDPVLVRPYVAGDEPVGSIETWPEPNRPDTAAGERVTGDGTTGAGTAGQNTAGQGTVGQGTVRQGTAGHDAAGAADAGVGAPGEPADADTAVLPAVAEPPSPPPPPARERPAVPAAARIGILVLGVGLALGVAAWFVLGFGIDRDAPMPSTALPAVGGRVPLGPSAAVSAAPTASPSAPASSPTSVPATVAGTLSPSPGVSPGASRQVLVPVVPSGGTAPPPTTAPAGEPEPTPEPPAADRTGRITAASGRCLTRGGLLGIDGSPVQVAGCLGGSTQSFTLATDGTLRVSGRCAQAAGDGTVRIDDCGDAAGAQWRAGPDGTLINKADDGCLTDPGRAGATATVAACTGSAEQTWSLP